MNNIKVRIIRSIFITISVAFVCLWIFRINAFAKTYSYRDLELDYDVERGLYSTGKRGYKFAFVFPKSKSVIKYNKAHVIYDEVAGHDVFSGYGKTYKANLTSKTRYYKCIEWSDMLKLDPFRLGYDSDTFKNLKLLKRVSKKELFGYNNLCYIKIKGRKVTTVIVPVIFAI